MTDKEYRDQKKRVQKFIDKWLTPMGLNWYRLTNSWARERKSDSPAMGAETEMRWQYHEYDFTWYLPVLAELGEEELEATVVHEFCHVLSSPLMHEDTEQGKMVYEHVTTTIQKAFIWAREAGKKDK